MAANSAVVGDKRQGKSFCKVCAANSRYVFTIESGDDEFPDLDVFLCHECGLLFVGTPLTETQLRFAYASEDFETYYEQIATQTDRKVARSLQNLSLLLPGFPKELSVLDVGCGNGLFLEALRKSYPSVRAVGHELPGYGASACEKKGFKVYTCGLEEVREKFSFVVLLDVAEHLLQPNRIFQICRSLLEDNGWLYIHTPRRCFWDNLFLACVEIPGLRTLSRRWLQTRVSIYHLQLWTEEALKCSLAQAGFELVYSKSELELSWPLQMYMKGYLGESLPSPFIKLITGVSKILFVWLRTLKNKAICLARVA